MREAEERSRVLFEESPHGIVVIDAETGQTIDANAVACAQLGYTRDELLTLRISDYEARESPEETRAHIERVRATGQDTFETQQRTKSGQVRDVRVSVRTVHLGERQAFYCIFEDTTTRKQAERALTDSQQLLSAAERIAGLGSYITDFSTGFWKSSAELDRIFGIDESYQHTVDGWLALVHPDWRALMEAYLTNEVLGKRVRFDKEYMIVRANDGAERWVHGQGVLECDAADRPVALRGTIQDINERKAAEAARQLQVAALDAAANGIVITDRSGTIVWVNRAFTTLTGYAAADVIGGNPRVLQSGAHNSGFYQSLWETVLSGQTWRGEMTNRRKDGRLYTENQTITPIADESGTVTHFIAIKEDATERQRLQAQLLHAQKMETVGRLAGGVAHDFANLLSVILGFTEFGLADLPPDSPVGPSLEEIRRAGESAAGLIRQLLVFSRQQVVQPTSFDVNGLVTETDKMIRRLIGEDIVVTISSQPAPCPVRMDRGQLQQVLMNLVVNARDAMPQGGRLSIETALVALDTHHVSAHRDAVPGDYVCITISDSGTGMTEDVRAHIFEPYFTTKALGKGTGLGLATSFGIIDQAGGHIAVYSEPGLGTAMKVHLPLDRKPASVAADSGGSRRAKPPASGRETILVVEDDAAVRHLIVRVLESKGYRVLSAANAGEALRIIEDGREPWDLMLTDIIMPGGTTGVELADRVRAMRPNVKVVFVSGFTHDGAVLGGMADVADAFVHKPFTTEFLCAKVREVLERG